MLKILKSKIYNLEETAIASGLPMSTDSSKIISDFKRLIKLGSAQAGSGHDCALKGILVSARIKYPLYWGKQFQRYHFADIVSSQSTMHRITKMDLDKCFNEYTFKYIIDIIKNYVEIYNSMEEDDVVYYGLDDIIYLERPDIKHQEIDKKHLFMMIISNCPSGLEMEMEITTNYLQLKTIYEQRKNHKLPDWHVFCDWIASLPLMESILSVPKNNEKIQ